MNGRTNSAGGALVSDMEIPLDPCTDFVGVRIKDLEYLGKVRLTWTDPKDKYATPEGEAMEDTDQLVSKWSYTQIVRQADRAPVNPSDGVTVCTETTRNQYQTTGFVDTTAESNVTYYYGAYAFNEDGVYSEVISNGVQPVSFSTTLADNTWEEIDQACTLGLAESLWEIGDTKDLEYIIEYPNNTHYNIPSVIVGFNHDDLTDGSGKAAITFGCRERYLNSKQYADDSSGSGLGSGTLYSTSELRSTLVYIYENELYTPKSVLKSVTKGSSYIHNVDSYEDINSVTKTCTTQDYLFAFSISELGFYVGTASYGGNGELTWEGDKLDLRDGFAYPYFSTQESRTVNGYTYWLRNSGDTTATSWGQAYQTNGYNAYAHTAVNYNDVVFGFCIGKVAV